MRLYATGHGRDEYREELLGRPRPRFCLNGAKPAACEYLPMDIEAIGVHGVLTFELRLYWAK